MTAEGAIEIWFFWLCFKGEKKTRRQVIEHFPPSHLIELEWRGWEGGGNPY